MEVSNGKKWSSEQHMASGKPVGPSKETEAMLGPVLLESKEHAVVSCSLGMTINIGNYESFRIDFGIEMPCEPKEVEAMKDSLFDNVAKSLFARRQEVLSTLGKQR